MCVIEIPDDIMQQAGLKDSHDAAVELACRLFDAERIDFEAAMRLSGLTHSQLVEELVARNIRVIAPTVEDLESDLASLRKLGL